jgi:hypothetical protein
VELYEVPGDHFTMMMGDGAACISRELDQYLAAGTEAGRRVPEPVAK